MSSQAVNVEILGKLTRVNCPLGQEESLIEAAKYLDNRLKEMTARTKITNEVQLLIFTALNISYELQTKNRAEKDQQNLIKKRMKLLSESIEDALCKVKSGQQQ
ncbi:cell division protein ZapA [Candidatus Photodesmus blepharus]|uniref:Cell division protein ZapA n=1 Tax=Candidatus Photodesmus blepharonis TaxID=1179155 RepID=A0A084CMH8_9GAMM|nr:cell division protein ZapA [Candidatus Photodesmus blepharus]KEY91007.1 cell division protein ZapA [Candidatus Photodesmus blepharus]